MAHLDRSTRPGTDSSFSTKATVSILIHTVRGMLRQCYDDVMMML